MKARALGRPCRPTRAADPSRPDPVMAGTVEDLLAYMENPPVGPVVATTPPRPVTAGTYRSPERPAKDHSTREARRTVAKAEAARRRAARDRGLGTVRGLVGNAKRVRTPKRDTVRQNRHGAR
jgi:hypothetical protein